MKNIQIIDSAVNATFSVFQATEEEYAAIFPDGRDMELVEDLIERLGDDEAGRVLAPLWDRPILKRDAPEFTGRCSTATNIGGDTSRSQSARSIGMMVRSTKPRDTSSRSIAESVTGQFIHAA